MIKKTTLLTYARIYLLYAHIRIIVMSVHYASYALWVELFGNMLNEYLSADK